MELGGGSPSFGPDTNISNLDWPTIKELANLAAENPADYQFLVGQTKAVSPTGYGDRYVRIIGVGHDKSSLGKTCGLTFCFTTQLYTQSGHSGTSPVTWDNSSLKNSLNSTFLSCLPSDLQGVIETASKPTSLSKALSVTNVDSKIWVLSGYEATGRTGIVGSSDVRSGAKEGTKYAYFSSSAATFGSYTTFTRGVGCWTNSVAATYNIEIDIDTDGTSITSSQSRSVTVGIVPCFCL